MIKINLMPWREEEYEQKKKKFYFLLGLVFLGAVFLGLCVHFYYQLRLNNQRIRNQYLLAQWSVYQAQLQNFRDLKKEEQILIEKISIVQALQAERNLSTKLFLEFGKLIPNDVYMESIERSGNTLKITGHAKQYSDIAELIRNSERSRFFIEAHLEKIVLQKNFFQEGFSMTFKIKEGGG